MTTTTRPKGKAARYRALLAPEGHYQNRVRELARLKGVGITEVSDATGLSMNTLRTLWYTPPALPSRAHTVETLAQYFGVEPIQLIKYQHVQ